jgi:hypothetical protein
MRFHPTITFEQYRSTCQAVAEAKPKRVNKRSWKELVVLAIVCLAFGLAAQIPVARVPVLSILAVLVLLWMFSKPLAKRSRETCLKAVYSQEQETLNNQVLTIDESGISCDRVDGQATSHHAWIPSQNALICRMPSFFYPLLTASFAFLRKCLHHPIAN